MQIQHIKNNNNFLLFQIWSSSRFPMSDKSHHSQFTKWNRRVLLDISLSFTSSLNQLLSTVILEEPSNSFLPPPSSQLLSQIRTESFQASKCLSLPPGFPVPSSLLPCITHTIIRSVSKAHLDHISIQWLFFASRMHILLRTFVIFHSETAYFSFNHISYIPPKPSMLFYQISL